MSKYIEIIPPANSTKENFSNTVELITEPFLVNTDAFKVEDFDLDTATGKQLDIIGEWVGLSRDIEVPITNIYFSFDISGVGFDEGVWKLEHDTENIINQLDDDTYRRTIKAKIIANHWDGTNESLPEIFEQLFTNERVRVFPVDNYDMTMTVYISGNHISNLMKAVILRGYLNVKPATVFARTYIISSENTALFGFDIDNEYVSGFDDSSWGVNLEEAAHGY